MNIQDPKTNDKSETKQTKTQRSTHTHKKKRKKIGKQKRREQPNQ